ncbi:centrosome and spindle pole-associated protein 1 isoform X1 [Labrus bergylta]|uniref:centrosome and spindle pole-associated protein 1 isoform X1 n=1 Tax=Labrus bergylta TaxID=56723 RepID=UPI003314109E
MPPASAAQGISPNAGYDLSWLLGTDYERRKNKLQQELQLDYKQHVAKKKDPKASEPCLQPQSLSLPIADKTSIQEKLREERNKEYNLFLQKQDPNRRLRRGAPPAATEPEHCQPSGAVCISSPAHRFPTPDTHKSDHHAHWERPAYRRDAATLTDAVEGGKRTGTWAPVHRGRKRWQIIQTNEPYKSEEELNTDKEEEFKHRRRHDTHTPEPEYKEERRSRERRANRAPQDIKEVWAPSGTDQSDDDLFGKSDLKTPDKMRTAARSRPAISQDKAEFATGLIIGATEEQTVSQLRKEQYKQELLKQIAEQRRNKIREKELELRVAATGATDPEKEPDRIKQFGAVNLHYDRGTQDISKKPGIDLESTEKDPHSQPKNHKATEGPEQNTPRGMSHVDYNKALSQLTGTTLPESGTRAAQGVPSFNYFNEDYHRYFSNMLGEAAMQRVPAVPPPDPPTVTNHYKTPYDAAYYYYGTRNPLDPNLPYYQNGTPGREQQSGNFYSPPQMQPPLRPTKAPDQRRETSLNVGEVLAENSKQRRESVQSYQEALRQQIKEREERRRREKEEKERYDAKIEAELMAHNPWGRSGGGAPLKDQNGNLISNLAQMHRANEESYRNPVSRNSGHTQSSPRGEAKEPLSHRLSGFSEVIYKDELKKQIEEKKQKQEEMSERMRIEDEKEEKRLEDQRACIQREYEEQQRKQKKAKQRLENQSRIHDDPKTNHRTEEKVMRREQEEIDKKMPESSRDGELKQAVLRYERAPSPPIPTLRKKETYPEASRPSSVMSQLSSRTECPVSLPSNQDAPEKMPQLEDGRQEVIRELSAIRRYLWKEQIQLEAQLGKTNSQNSNYAPPSRPRGRPRVGAFEWSPRQAALPPTRSPSSGAALVNMQNIREFNQLKYRDTESSEGVRHMYPDPPTDAQSLDIQQQALLREQQHKIRRMKREEEHDFWDQELNTFHARNKPGRFIHRDSILPSQSAFIDVYSGDASDDQVHQQRQQREGTATRRRHDYDETTESLDQRERLAGDHTTRSEWLSGDEADVLSLRSALERGESVATVATEPWLRPGTPDDVTHTQAAERGTTAGWILHPG